MKNLVWTKGTSGLEGEFQSMSEVDFYIDKVSLYLMANWNTDINNYRNRYVESRLRSDFSETPSFC